jgi:hypothetical protein
MIAGFGNSVLPDCRANLKFPDNGVWTWCFLIVGLTWRFFLISGFQKLRFPAIIAQWFFLCQLRFFNILLDFIKDLREKLKKHIYNALGLDGMHASLLVLNIAPLLWCSIVVESLCLLSKSFFIFLIH